MKIIKILLTVLLIIGIFIAAVLAYNKLSAEYSAGGDVTPDNTSAQSESNTVSQAMKAPDFTVYTYDGQQTTMKDFSGKPAVINLWASWCSPCRSEFPHFEQAYKAYGNDINFLMIDLNGFGNDNAVSAQKLIADGGYTFPVYFDNDGSAAAVYAARSIPVTVFINADGEIVKTQVGAMSADMLENNIALIK